MNPPIAEMVIVLAVTPMVGALFGATEVAVPPPEAVRVPVDDPPPLDPLTAPVSEPADFYHWHIEILPKVTRFGAFEWATGFHRNPTLPETAAKVLREAV